MPRRAPSACPREGCPHAMPCPDHTDRWAAGRPGRTMPAGWAATRARILIRDAFTCQRCGGPATEVHHIQRGIEADWNLQSLCSPCHVTATQAQAAAIRAQLRSATVDHPQPPRWVRTSAGPAQLIEADWPGFLQRGRGGAPRRGAQ